jgi:uncharacterized membrane protein (UPF0127 family)
MLASLVLADTGVVLAERLRDASSIGARMRGLLGQTPLESGEGLLLRPCKQVHTFGMRYPIDVVFCDEAMTVIHIEHELLPWRVSGIHRRARCAIELPAGAASAVTEGDRLSVKSPAL